jgi:hypothetical protein
VLRFLGFVLVFGVGVAVGWTTRGTYQTVSSVSSKLSSVSSGLSRLESALKSENLDQAEHTLSEIKDAALKETKALEVRLLSARINRALAHGHVDQAKTLLQKARASGTVAEEQLKKWEDQISAAEKAASSGSV